MFILFLLLVSAYADTPCPTAAPSSTGYATLDISQSQCKEYALGSSCTDCTFHLTNTVGQKPSTDDLPAGCVKDLGSPEVYWVDPGFREEHQGDDKYSLLDANGDPLDVTQHTPGFPSYGSLGQPCGTNNFECVKCLECTGNQMVAYDYKVVNGAEHTFSYAISRHMCISRYGDSNEERGINTLPNNWNTPFGCGFNTFNSDYYFYQWTKHPDTITCGTFGHVGCLTVDTATCVDPCSVDKYYDGSSCQQCGASPNGVSNTYLPYGSHTYQHCVPAHWSTCGELPNPDGQIGQRYISGDKTTRKCEECPIGYAAPFGTGNTDTECNLCSGGYGGNGTHCNKCPVDKYQAHKSPLGTPCADKACPKGQGVGDNADSFANDDCHVCQAGTFSNSDTTGQCVACDGANFYTATNGDFTLTGAQQCLECPAGEYNTDSSSICCPAGQVPNQDNTACVPCTGCDCIVGTVLTVPDQYTIDMRNDLQGCNNFNTITEINMPEATSLPDYAFSRHFQPPLLTTVNIPKVTSIGINAFLQNFAPGGTFVLNAPLLETIGYIAFYYSNIISINAPLVTTLGTHVFVDSKIQTIDFPELLSVPERTFLECNSLTTVNLAKVKSINKHAFAQSSLTSIHAPLVETIGSSAFISCNELQTIDFPEGVTIGEYAFHVYGAHPSISVNLPKVTYIDEYAFQGRHFTSINAPLVEHIGTNTFIQSDVVTLNFPEVTSFGQNSVPSLKTVIFPKYEGVPDLPSSNLEYLETKTVKRWSVSSSTTLDAYMCAEMKSAFRDKCSCS